MKQHSLFFGDEEARGLVFMGSLPSVATDTPTFLGSENTSILKTTANELLTDVPKTTTTIKYLAIFTRVE